MTTTRRYAITLPGTPGSHQPAEVVVVHATGETTADGTPVYADTAGTFRVAITGNTARPSPNHPDPDTTPASTPHPCPAPVRPGECTAP